MVLLACLTGVGNDAVEVGLIGPGCLVAAGPSVGPNTVLSRDVVVGAKTSVREAAVLRGTYFGSGLKVINVPIAKTHSLSVLTLAMKNWMGIMGGVRFRVHQRLDESLVDLCRVIKLTLTVLDAVRILTANGPTGGDLDDVKRLDTIVVGTDQVAIDSFGATLFGMKGSDLGSVKLAAKAGLGVMDLSKLQIKRISA